MADLNNIGEQPELFKLFVGQIPKDMDELNLRPYFEEFGHIVEISIIRDNITMMSKGQQHNCRCSLIVSPHFFYLYRLCFRYIFI